MAVLKFDVSKDAYLRTYAIGNLTKGDRVWDPMTDVPYWAKANGTVKLMNTETLTKEDDVRKKVTAAVNERDQRAAAGLDKRR